MTKAKKTTLRKRTDRIVRIQDKLSERQRIEAIRTARALALAGLPKRRSKENRLSRTLRLGSELWLRVTYASTEGNELPFGEDRFVLAGIQHLAIEADSPIVLFDRVGQLLKTFGLSEDGRTVARLRQRFKRLSGLSVRLLFGRTEEELNEGTTGEQLFIIRKFSLPTRKDLKTEKAGQMILPGSHPYGVMLYLPVQLRELAWSHGPRYSPIVAPSKKRPLSVHESARTMSLDPSPRISLS